MDLRSFRTQYQDLSSLADRTQLLLEFAEGAMQSCPEDLAPLLEDCRHETLLAGREDLAAYCDRLLAWMALDRGDFPAAMAGFCRARDVFARLGDDSGRLKVLNGIASTSGLQGRYDESLAVYLEALALAESLGDQGQTLVLLANIGEDLTSLQQYSTAVPYFERALAPRVLSPLNESLILAQLGRATEGLGRIDEARAHLERAVALARQGAYLSALALSLGRLGSLELTQGDLDRAEILLEESRGLARQALDRASETQTIIDLGRLKEARGATDEAARLYRDALTMAVDLGAKPLERDAARGLASAEKALGRWQQAFEAYERFHRLAQDLLGDNVARQMAHLRADWDRRETELLREQTRTLAVLGDLGQRITASLDLETVMVTVYEGIGALMQVETFGLGLYDEKTNTVDYQLSIEAGVRLPPYRGPVSDESFSGWVVRNRRDLVVGDVRTEYSKYIPKLPPSIGNQGRQTRSCLYTPLLAGDKILGILTAQSYQAFAYGDRDLATFKTLGTSIAVAVQNARLFAEVNLLATVDALTGAATRRHLFERTEEEFQRFLREGHPLALIMMDLDHFKELNDTWGHAVGDRVLAEFGALCLAQKRPHDLFGRYGGEEFALVLSGSSLEGAAATAQRLCEEVQALPLEARPGTPIQLTASFGVTAFDPSDQNITRVFGRADEALYEAKEAGRNRTAVRTADPSRFTAPGTV